MKAVEAMQSAEKRARQEGAVRVPLESPRMLQIQLPPAPSALASCPGSASFLYSPGSARREPKVSGRRII